MKKKSLLKFCLFLFSLISFDTLNAQSSCNCIANLDTTIKKTEVNYVGYPDMIARNQEVQYKKMVARLRASAKNESDPRRCFSILKEYVVFFNDKHYDLEYTIADSTMFKYNFIDESRYRKEFVSKKREPIEGIWISPDSSLKLAVYKVDPKTYQAVVLESRDQKIKPGLIYYTFSKTGKGLVFDRFDWMTPEFPVRQRGNLLYIWNFEVLAKVFPGTLTESEKYNFGTWRNYAYGLDCRKLDENNVLLTIGSFNRDNMIKDIIKKNDSLIRSSRHLIVDLRGNGGGNSGWSYLLPYFYTNTIQQGDTYLRLSPLNNAANLPSFKSMYENPKPDPRWEKSYTAEYREKFKEAFEQIPQSKQTFYTIPSLDIYADSVLKTPEKVALIFDDLGGSSTEYFFFISKQSTKVKRYGERTLGMMDYMGASTDSPLPFKDYYLMIPDRKATWTDTAPTNITGFIPENDLRHLPRESWIDFIKKDLGK
ncbi:MAG: hypothetical protein ABW174_12260 [Flavitalea sp.]